MKLAFRLKHYLFNGFREFFVHHHGSLEFRAKIFALVIAANEKSSVECYIFIKNYALYTYDDDIDRANLLMLTTKEIVKKIHDDNGLDLDTLVANIQSLLKVVPRYAKKIELEPLREIVALTHDEDTYHYQMNILEFLQTLKDETLETKKSQIAHDEGLLHLKEKTK